MALREATITFYQIEECGYYRRRDKAAVFGETAVTLRNLAQWSRGKRVSLTKLWELTEQNDDQLPVYLFDMKQDGGDWLIATWNEVSSTENAVLSIAEQSVVGMRAETHANEVVDRTIPGFPAYFWFLPDRGVMATIKFERTPAAKDAMVMYLLHYMRQESPYVVQDDDGNIIGYEDATATERTTGKPYPRFKVSPYAKPGEVDLILRSRESIRKIVRSGVLHPNNAVDTAAFGGLLAFLRGVKRNRSVVGEQKVKIEMDLTPTADELKSMVDIELSLDRNKEWGGLGVVLQGEGGRVRWVSHSLARDTFEFELRLDSSGVVMVESLLGQLQSSKNKILRILE